MTTTTLQDAFNSGLTVRAFVTAAKWYTDSEFSDPAEVGWVSQPYESDIHESRNYVRPIEFHRDDYESFDELARDIERLLVAFNDNGDGTSWYLCDTVILDHTTDETYNYGIHFHVKDYFNGNWCEIPCDVSVAQMGGHK